MCVCRRNTVMRRQAANRWYICGSGIFWHKYHAHSLSDDLSEVGKCCFFCTYFLYESAGNRSTSLRPSLTFSWNLNLCCGQNFCRPHHFILKSCSKGQWRALRPSRKQRFSTFRKLEIGFSQVYAIKQEGIGSALEVLLTVIDNQIKDGMQKSGYYDGGGGGDEDDDEIHPIDESFILSIKELAGGWCVCMVTIDGLWSVVGV